MWSSPEQTPRASVQPAAPIRSLAALRSESPRPNSYGCPRFSVVRSFISSPIARHMHNDYFIGFHFAGQSRCILPGKSHLEFSPGEVGFIRPGTVHEDVPLSPQVEYIALRIRESYFEEVRTMFGHCNFFPESSCAKMASDTQLTSTFEALRLELINKELGHEVAIQSLVNELVVHLFRRLTPGGSKLHSIPSQPSARMHWPVRRAAQYLESHYTEDFDLATTAAAVGISKFYLVRLFRSNTGLTLGNYLLQFRAEKAKDLLVDPSRSISDVAMALGFADQSHFTRVFKRFTGMTPLAFRQGAR